MSWTLEGSYIWYQTVLDCKGICLQRFHIIRPFGFMTSIRAPNRLFHKKGIHLTKSDSFCYHFPVHRFCDEDLTIYGSKKIKPFDRSKMDERGGIAYSDHPRSSSSSSIPYLIYTPHSPSSSRVFRIGTFIIAAASRSVIFPYL